MFPQAFTSHPPKSPSQPQQIHFAQVLLIRKDLFQRFRLEHGLRIQEDRCGKGAIQVSIATRIGWASSTWLSVLNDMVGQLGGLSSGLRRWGVIKPMVLIPSAAAPDPLSAAPALQSAAPGPESAAPGPSLAAVGLLAVDDFLLQTAETMSRTFCGLTARALCLWQGGVYNMVKLLSTDPVMQQEAVLRAQRLFPRILALEALLSSGDCPAGVRVFSDRYLWIGGVVYRELLGLLSEGQLEFAKQYAWRVHGSVHHEKGPRKQKQFIFPSTHIRSRSLSGEPTRSLSGDTPPHPKTRIQFLLRQTP